MSFVAGVAVGGGLLYFFDPILGRRRRHQLRDRGNHALSMQRRLLAKAVRDLSHRAEGAVERLRHPLGDVSDDVLAARVRSRLGRCATHASAIDVTSAGRIVTLRGPILADEHAGVVRDARHVAGVHEIVDELEPHDTSSGVPGLQGTGRRPRPMWRREVWSPLFRVAGIAAGGVLGATGLRLGRITGTATAVAGIALAARAATNLPARRLLGIGAGRRAIDLQKSLYIDAPVGEVFGLWSAFERFPLFMEHVQDVRVSDADPGVSTWKVEGPGGHRTEWTIEITRRIDGELLAWKTRPGASVEHAGIMRFEPEATGTRVHIRLSYNPPAGAVGHALLRLVGSDFKSRLDDDLIRMKSLLERGITRAHGRRVSLDEATA